MRYLVEIVTDASSSPLLDSIKEAVAADMPDGSFVCGVHEAFSPRVEAMLSGEVVVLVTGNPLDGLTMYGPYRRDEAESKVEHFAHNDWWITGLEKLS